MAILIGVIALAVIPNIQRSRESKDLTALDNILSSTNIAIANLKVTTDGNFEYPTSDPGAGSDTAGKLKKAVWDELGAVSLNSTAASNTGKIFVVWKASSASAASITVKVSGSATATATDCEYTKDENGGKAKFLVSSGSASAS